MSRPTNPPPPAPADSDDEEEDFDPRAECLRLLDDLRVDVESGNLTGIYCILFNRDKHASTRIRAGHFPSIAAVVGELEYWKHRCLAGMLAAEEEQDALDSDLSAPTTTDTRLS